jgi:hypothetical protein
MDDVTSHARNLLRMHIDEETSCAIQVHAKLVSLNGGVVLAVCIVLSAISAAAFVSAHLTSSQGVLFGVLSLFAWLYLIDSVTEHLALQGDVIEKSSFLSRRMTVALRDMREMLLIHEGLNQEVGIESLVVRYRGGKTEKLPLGPCWRRHELEAFLRSVEQAIGSPELLEEVRL